MSILFDKEDLEDTKRVIRIHKSKKNRHHNGLKKNDKRTNNDLQNTTQKTNDRATRTPLKQNSCSTCGASRVILVTNVMINYEGGKDRGMLTTSKAYPWSFVTQILNNV